MAAAFASVEHLRAHWAAMPADRADEATAKLDEASIEVRANYRDIDRRITLWTSEPENPLALDPDVARLVVVRMVKRAMAAVEPETPAMASFQVGTGPFQLGGKVHNPEGNIYLSKAERRMLEPPRAESGRPFTIYT